ncbi:hypothetical protein O181_019058 [Austropuccinia psidii MF-1]|uniref:Aminopeptidase P N-terminal domain-containing protein n=1 Tax=Austropuccinia psidii MF-1 TaxID=1389203 RepID=A0A9Q3C8Z4_9BASI|nr:hypothetical protein [Austropuccinia psidii MF-1]
MINLISNLIYPARHHASKVFNKLVEFNPIYKNLKHLPIIYLEGNKTKCRDEDTDRELKFHQESNFMYLTGAHDLPNASALVYVTNPGSINEQNISPNHISIILFIKPIDPLEVMWSGLPPSIDQLKKLLPDLTDIRYQIDFDDHLNSLINQFNPQILTLPKISHSKAQSDSALLKAIHEARTTKTDQEIQIMRYANQISSHAHTCLIKSINSPNIQSELDAESIFLFQSNRQGAKHQAYEPIFGYGHNAGTLHYNANDAKFPPNFQGVLLVDAGVEILGYASDITRTLPVGNNGKFTPESRSIYSIVLEMQNAALQNIKPGIDWQEIQIMMHKVAAKGLLELGILKNRTIDECYEEGHVVPFFPHGVGHFLGLDTHDVGGLPNGKVGKHATMKYLRLQRKLEAGNVVTVEPGLYFNEFLLEPVKGSEFVDDQVLKNYMNVGGIRIEDNVVVTEEGCENLTIVVKSIEDIEKLTDI